MAFSPRFGGFSFCGVHYGDTRARCIVMNILFFFQLIVWVLSRTAPLLLSCQSVDAGPSLLPVSDRDLCTASKPSLFALTIPSFPTQPSLANSCWRLLPPHLAVHRTLNNTFQRTPGSIFGYHKTRSHCLQHMGAYLPVHPAIACQRPPLVKRVAEAAMHGRASASAFYSRPAAAKMHMLSLAPTPF